MGCTTILVGKNASYDGSTIVARNEDSPTGIFKPKRVVIVHPEDQPRTYTSVLSHVTIDLPDNPMRYSAAPNALLEEGLWAQAGINSANVAMSATETLTSNERVLGADPLVELQPAQGTPGEDGYLPEVPGGIGEEDFVTLVLPYINSAREGVLRLGSLLEQYGTYEMNGIAFSDVDEIWWLETVGGHHWIARRVPDDVYVTMPNQLGIDEFDLDDALGEGRDFLASADLKSFIADNFLDLSLGANLNPRDAFGSHSDADHVYNTPRAWFIQKKLNPNSPDWQGADPRLKPDSDNLPWCRVPERKVTIEDIKYLLSSHFQGTVYDPYSSIGTEEERNLFRPIGVNRHSQLAVLQIRPYRPESSRSIQWMAYASNPFNALVPLYTNVSKMPDYLSNTTGQVDTNSFYWASRLIAALADAHYFDTIGVIDDYQQTSLAAGHAMVKKTDALLAASSAEDEDEASIQSTLEAGNDEIAQVVRSHTDAALDKVLLISSNGMRNGFLRSVK